jgi:hypothetical protein
MCFQSFVIYNCVRARITQGVVIVYDVSSASVGLNRVVLGEIMALRSKALGEDIPLHNCIAFFQ